MPTNVVDADALTAPARLPNGSLTVAGSTSLGAGAVHAFLAGDFGGHHRAAVLFVVIAVFQVAWGGWAMGHAERRTAISALVVNLGLGALWLAVWTTGVSFVDWLDDAGPIRFIEVAALGLTVFTAFAVLARLLDAGPQDSAAPAASRWITPIAVAAVVAVAGPAMVSTAGNGPTPPAPGIATDRPTPTTATTVAAVTPTALGSSDIDAALAAEIAAHDRATTAPSTTVTP